MKDESPSKTIVKEAFNIDDAKIKVAEFIEDDCCILFENDLPDNYM